MLIGVACTMNQARSPFAQAALQQNFAEHKFFSTGVEAIFGTPIMDSVQAVAKEWGMKIPKRSSTTIFNDERLIRDADLVLVAEDSQKEAITLLGFKKSLKSFSEIFEDKDFTPRDPEGLSFDAVKREMGKVAAVSIRAVLDASGFAHRHPIIAIIPHGVSDMAMALAHAQLERINRNAILIDADIRAPHQNEITELGLTPVTFDIQKLSQTTPADLQSNAIFTHIREVDFPEKFFIQSTWRLFLQKLSDVAPVVIVTAPRHSHMRKLADSYLASYMADEFSVISC